MIGRVVVLRQLLHARRHVPVDRARCGRRIALVGPSLGLGEEQERAADVERRSPRRAGAERGDSRRSRVARAARRQQVAEDADLELRRPVAVPSSIFPASPPSVVGRRRSRSRRCRPRRRWCRAAARRRVTTTLPPSAPFASARPFLPRASMPAISTAPWPVTRTAVTSAPTRQRPCPTRRARRSSASPSAVIVDVAAVVRGRDVADRERLRLRPTRASTSPPVVFEILPCDRERTAGDELLVSGAALRGGPLSVTTRSTWLTVVVSTLRSSGGGDAPVGRQRDPSRRATRGRACPR